MNRITKKEMIDVYEITMNEYINQTHTASIKFCLKCKTFVQKIRSEISCSKCPENVFAEQYKSNSGCLHRNITPRSSYYVQYDRNKINALVDYHREAINYLKTVKKYSFKRFCKKLLEIDSAVSNKYHNTNKNESKIISCN